MTPRRLLGVLGGLAGVCAWAAAAGAAPVAPPGGGVPEPVAPASPAERCPQGSERLRFFVFRQRLRDPVQFT